MAVRFNTYSRCLLIHSVTLPPPRGLITPIIGGIDKTSQALSERCELLYHGNATANGRAILNPVNQRTRGLEFPITAKGARTVHD